MSALPVVLWSQMPVGRDPRPDRCLLGEERPEDHVRIAESEPGVVGSPSWPASAGVSVSRWP